MEPAFFMLPILLMWSTSTEGTTIVMSKVSPLNRRCLCDECRWFNTNSGEDKKLHSEDIMMTMNGEIVGYAPEGKRPAFWNCEFFELQ